MQLPDNDEDIIQEKNNITPNILSLYLARRNRIQPNQVNILIVAFAWSSSGVWDGVYSSLTYSIIACACLLLRETKRTRHCAWNSLHF